MNFSPRLDLEFAFILAGLAIVTALYWAFRSKAVVRKAWRAPILLCRLLFIALLFLIFLNPIATRETDAPKVETLLLLDCSTSMGLDAPDTRLERAKDWAAQIANATELGQPPRLASFSDQLAHLDELQTLTLSGDQTNLGAALNRILDSAGQTLPSAIVIVSDGRMSDRSELNTALARARTMGIQFFTHTVGDELPPRNAAIRNIDAPRSARAETKVPVTIELRTEGYQENEELTLTIADESGETIAKQKVKASLDPIDFKIPITTGIRNQTYQVALTEDPNEISHTDNSSSFTVEVRSNKLRVLYLEGTHHRRFVNGPKSNFYWNEMEFITRALESTGEIEVDSFTPLSQRSDTPNLYYIRDFVDGQFQLDASRTFPPNRAELFKYDVVICSDVPVGNFNQTQMDAVVELVTERGGGFCMIGGYTSFDSGNYDRTTWEKITPVDMVNFGHGHTSGVVKFKVPTSVYNHPIWQILDEPSANRKLLESHPPFHGYHNITRAKPGATLLGLRGDGGGPLLAVQNYGRGRSMAYLSDVNGGWGNSYITWGAEKTGSLINGSQELGRGAVLLNRSRSLRHSSNKTLTHPSPYQARFWLNTVRWLGEKSIRQQRSDLLGQVESLSLRPGEEVNVSAEVFAALPPQEIPDLAVTAHFSGIGGKPQRLEWDPNRREFTGLLRLPESVSTKNVSILFETQYRNASFQDKIDISVLKVNPEFENTLPDHQLMSDLAKNSGGKQVKTPKEAISALSEVIATSEKSKIPFTEPQWDRWWIWLLALALLTLEWLLRRKAGYPKISH